MTRRSGLGALAAALVLGAALAAAPATNRADIDHEVALTVGDTAAVDGGMAGGINYTPIVTGGTQPEPTCAKTPDAYCEATLVELTAVVPDDAPRGRLKATFDLLLSAQAPISDFDVFVYETDESGERGGRLASSGALAGGQVAPVQDGIFWRCPASDECVELPITFHQGAETTWLLVEVHYAVAPVPYSMDLGLS